MSVLISRAIGKELVAALGLQGRHVKRIQLDIPHDGIVTMVVTEYVDDKHKDDLPAALAGLKPVEAAPCK